MPCTSRMEAQEPSPAIRGRRGFALVFSLALMSLVFFLVIALVSYVAMELRLAETRKTKTLSRAHAKMGLMVALGELQKHAGPDRRVTARASILDKDPYTAEADGVEHPHWTGVWKRNPSVAASPPYGSTSEPWEEPPTSEWDPHPEVELAWLVSGNEGKSAGEQGYRHPASSEFSDPDYAGDAVWLVNQAVAKPSDRVAAAKTSISLSEGSGTGSSSAASRKSGNYAYWVGDEGVKAKLNLPQPESPPDPKADFLLNQTRFEVSPGPNLALAQSNDGSLDLASLEQRKLEKTLNLSQLRLASADSDDYADSARDYFQTLTTDGHGVLADVRNGGLKRDLTAGLGDDDQFASHLANRPIFKDRIRFMKDYNPLDWSKDANRHLKWYPGMTNEMRWMRGPLWDYLRDYYKLHEKVNFSPSSPLDASLAPQAPSQENFPNRNGEFWTESYRRSDPRTHPITPVLLEAKVGHTLEMVPTGQKDKKGKDLYRPQVAIYPSLALWNPYNVELEEASYELVWQPDPKFWVYPSRERERWARAIMKFEEHKRIPPRRRLWDKDGDGRLSSDREYYAMHDLFLGSKKGRNIPYNMSPGQGGGGVDSLFEGKGLRSLPRLMHRRAFFLYRFAPRPREHESVSGWVRFNGHWHTIPGGAKTRKPLRLRTNPVRLAPGEKLYFTLAQTKRFNPADEHVFQLRNHLSFSHHLYYSVPRLLCPALPADEPVTFVYTGGGIGGHWLDPFQKDQERDEANKNPKVLGTTLFMIRGSKRYTIKEVNRGIGAAKLKDAGSYQDYGRSDIVASDPSRVIGPRMSHLLSTHHRNPQLVLLEHNPRSMVDPWHLGQGNQWWRGHETDLEDGMGDLDLSDDQGVVFSVDPSPDESLSGDFYNGSGGRTYYGYQGHSFDVAGFQRVSQGNNGEQQYLPPTSRIVLFDVPRQPLLSLASLQHMNLSYFGNSPSYVIGNSYATSLVSRHRKWTRFNQLSHIPINYSATNKRSGNEHQNTIIDYSYYANEALWDGFFFSSVPTRYQDIKKYPPHEAFDQYFVDNRKPLPNARMVFHTGTDRIAPKTSGAGSLRQFGEAAGNLLVDGAFNVNSTSVKAWKAQLGSLAKNQLHLRDLQDSNELVSGGRRSLTLDFPSGQFPFPRLGSSMGQPVNPESGNLDQDFWTGFAGLNEGQLQRLAEEVVQEVKYRGPFLSMSDFVNRRLSSPPGYQIVRKLNKQNWPKEDEASKQGLRGAIQAAIHDAGINDGGFRAKYGHGSGSYGIIPNNVGQYNVFGYVAAGLNNDRTDPAASQIPHHRSTDWGIGKENSINRKKAKNQPGVIHISQAPRKEFSHGEAPENMLAAKNGVTGAMIPGWLSQADVLTSLAPVTNVRSDTFMVRTYGDVDPDRPEVKVWCEAIVQRLPEYLVNEKQSTSAGSGTSYGGDSPEARPPEPFEDLNGNGMRDSNEPFTDLYPDGRHGVTDDYGGKKINNPLNQTFGRRFRILRFRWLTEDEV